LDIAISFATNKQWQKFVFEEKTCRYFLHKNQGVARGPFCLILSELPSSSQDGLIFSGYFHAVNCGHHSGSSEGNRPNGRKFTSENNSDLKSERKK
jgi:hypothetical protein